MKKPLLMLAPMAGFSDKAMRKICSDMGCDIAVSEMVSAKAIHYKDSKTDTLAELDDIQCSQAIQIFGSDAEIMAEAAEYLCAKYNPDYIDINMGCPVKKISGNGDGAALMKEPVKAAGIVSAVAKSVKTPVSVKIRSGWDDRSKNAPEFAKRMEASGAALITVHGRTKQQMYSLPVDTDIIAEVKKSVSVPVIANGGINSVDDAVNMLNRTGCDGLALARGVIGNPWLFSNIRSYFLGKPLTIPTVKNRIETAEKHLKLEIQNKGELTGVRESKSVIGHYLFGLKGAAFARMKINMSESANEIFEILKFILTENN